MTDITTQIIIGAAGSLLASLVIFILGWMTRRGATPKPPRQQNVGVLGTNYGTVQFDQRQVNTTVHSSTVVHGGSGTGNTGDDFPIGWVVGGVIAALALGVLVAAYWRSVVAVTLPFGIAMTVVMIILVIFARRGLRGRHVTTLCLGAVVTLGSIATLHLFPGIDDISRAVGQAEDIGAKAAVIRHLSADKGVQLTGAGVALAGLIMLTALLVWMTAAAVAANAVPDGSVAGRLHGLVSSSMRVGALVGTSSIPVVLTGAGLWTVSIGFQLAITT